MEDSFWSFSQNENIGLKQNQTFPWKITFKLLIYFQHVFNCTLCENSVWDWHSVSPSKPTCLSIFVVYRFFRPGEYGKAQWFKRFGSFAVVTKELDAVANCLLDYHEYEVMFLLDSSFRMSELAPENLVCFIGRSSDSHGFATLICEMGCNYIYL